MKLASRAEVGNLATPVIGRITTRPTPEIARRADEVFLSTDPEAVPELAGYAAVLRPVPQMPYLADGDVVSISPDGWVRALYRKSSRHNTILMTEQCNSYCLMC